MQSSLLNWLGKVRAQRETPCAVQPVSSLSSSALLTTATVSLKMGGQKADAICLGSAVSLRAITVFAYLRGEAAATTHRHLKDVFGDKAPTMQSVYNWRKWFGKSNEPPSEIVLSDLPRSGSHPQADELFPRSAISRQCSCMCRGPHPGGQYRHCSAAVVHCGQKPRFCARDAQATPRNVEKPSRSSAIDTLRPLEEAARAHLC